MGRWFFILIVLVLVGCGSAGEHRKEVDPQDAFDSHLTIALAETMIEAKAHQNAVHMLRKARHRNPEDPRIIYLLATVLRDRGAYKQAEKEFIAALALDSKLAPAHSGLAVTYDLMSRFTDAVAYHKKAIELSPKTPRFHNNFGFSLYLSGQYELAKNAYEEAIRLDPSAHTPYVNLGFTYARMGKDEPALRAFRQVVSEAEALNNMALAYELNGNRSTARTYYLKSLEIDPDLAEAKSNLRAMEAGLNQP